MPKSWYQKTFLDSGLPVLVAPLHSPSVTAVFLVRTGSKNETVSQAGISHLLEHFVFRGTATYPHARDVVRALDSIGASHNASTGKEFTMYWVKASAAHLARAIDVLAQIVLKPRLPNLLLSKEKGTILQEIAMYEDHPMMKVEERFENLLYGQLSRLGRDIIGTPQTVSSLTRDQLVAYRQHWYQPERMVFAVAGGANVSQVVRCANEKFGTLDIFDTAGTVGAVGELPPMVETATTRRLVQYRATDQAHLVFGVPALRRLDARRYALAVLTTILGGNTSSQLFQEVRERRGLAYYVRAEATRFDEAGYTSVRAGVPPQKAKIVEELVRTMLFRFNATEREFSEAKEFLKGQLALVWEESSHIATHLAEEFLAEPNVRSMEDILQKLNEVKRSHVDQLAAEIFRNPDELYVAGIGPVDEKLQATSNKRQARKES